MTKREMFYEEHKTITQEMFSLVTKKNQDYASAEDPFENFRMFGRYGILTRMGDKLSRLKTLYKNGKQSVNDETVKDTCLDLMNYAIFYLTYDGAD